MQKDELSVYVCEMRGKGRESELEWSGGMECLCVCVWEGV